MDDYHCVTILARPNEGESDFKRRLSGFWTHMLRQHESDYERVYAEMVDFETISGRLARKYLIEAGVAKLLSEQLRVQQFDFAPIDLDDLYSKFEATPPEWFWIEH